MQTELVHFEFQKYAGFVLLIYSLRQAGHHQRLRCGQGGVEHPAGITLLQCLLHRRLEVHSRGIHQPQEHDADSQATGRLRARLSEDGADGKVLVEQRERHALFERHNVDEMPDRHSFARGLPGCQELQKGYARVGVP